MKKQIAAAVTALALTLGGLALAAPAMADDTPAPASQEVASSPDTSTSPSSPTSPADTPAATSETPTPTDEAATPATESPVVADPPTAAADQPSTVPTSPTPLQVAPPVAPTPPSESSPPSKGHTPVVLCHKPNTPAQQTLTVDDNAVKGHLGHGDTLGECATPVEGWWLMPDGGTASHVTWEGGQDATPAGVVPCGVTAQVDTYPSQAVLDQLAADGKLYEGEDSSVVMSWRFVYGGDCPVVQAPNPHANIIVTCGVATPWVSNDLGDAQERLTASFVVYVDGVFNQALTAAGGEVNSGTAITFPEDSGDHTVTVRTGPAFGDELLATATVTSDCQANILNDAAAALTYGQPTCDKDGTVSVDEDALENASLQGKLDSTVGDHTATFVADEGHAFADGESTLEIDYTVKAKTGDCPVTTPTPTPAPGQVAGPAPTDSPVAFVTASDDGSLADTGSTISAAGPIFLAGLCLAFGVIALAGGAEARRRRAQKAGR